MTAKYLVSVWKLTHNVKVKTPLSEPKNKITKVAN